MREFDIYKGEGVGIGPYCEGEGYIIFNSLNPVFEKFTSGGMKGNWGCDTPKNYVLPREFYRVA